MRITVLLKIITTIIIVTFLCVLMAILILMAFDVHSDSTKFLLQMREGVCTIPEKI